MLQNSLLSWGGARCRVSYPAAWTLTFPDRNVERHALNVLPAWNRRPRPQTAGRPLSWAALPPPDILLTHDCGSPPPIAGANPHLRPPRHAVCSPTMHLHAQTFPDTFGLLSIAYSPPPQGPLSFSRPPHGSLSSSFICSQLFFLELSKFPPFLSLFSPASLSDKSIS